MGGGVPTAHAAAHQVDGGVGRLAVEAGGAQLVADALDLLAGEADSLVPADDLPLVLTAHGPVGIRTATGLPALALQRMQDAVGAEALLLLGLAAHAAALLGILGGILVAVVGFLAHYDAVLHHHLVHAATAAVVPAGCGHPGASFFGIGHDEIVVLAAGLGDFGTGSAAHRRQGSRRCGDGAARLNELTTTQRVVRRRHMRFFHCLPLHAFRSETPRAETMHASNPELSLPMRNRPDRFPY